MKHLFIGLLCLILLIPQHIWNAGAVNSQTLEPSEVAPLSSALHLLPPLGKDEYPAPGADRTLLGHLLVTICQVQGKECIADHEFSYSKVRICRANGAGRGDGVGCMRPHEFALQGTNIGQQNKLYHLTWPVSRLDAGKAHEIHINVAGLEIGSVTYTPTARRSVPVWFYVDDHPRIRARVHREQGYTAAEIAGSIAEEFVLEPPNVALILREEAYGPVEVLEAVRDTFDLGPAETSLALKDSGYSVASLFQAVKTVFGLDLDATRSLLEGIGFSSDEIFQAEAAELAVRFAPQLRFDGGSYSCPGLNSFPMSAQEYYTLKSRDPGKEIVNGDAATLTNNKIPIYWKAFKCEKQIRLVYWIFYGYQDSCDCGFTEGVEESIHDADWEHLLVVLSENTKIALAVTYFQHGGYYTRYAGRYGFNLVEGTHPVAYVGRTSHGNYHETQTSFQTCCYWEDHRDGNGPTMNSWLGPVIQMRPVSEGGEPWMDADKAATFKWGGIWTHPMTNSSGDCGQLTCAGTTTWGCHESGCFRSQCELGDRDDGLATCWHCPSGYTDCGAYCVKGGAGNCINPFASHASINTYNFRYQISNSDAGLLYKAP